MSATSAWRSRVWLATALTLTFLKIWLTRGQGLQAIGSQGPDDRLYLELAHHLVHGSWLGNYNELTLAHGPFYPLFIATAFGLGVPLALAQHVFYAAACAWFSCALRPAVAAAGVRCAIYLLLLWNPMTFDAPQMGRVLPQHVQGPLALLIVAGLVALYLRRDQPLHRQAAWAGLLGLASGSFYLTREDNAWFAPIILILGSACLVGAARLSRAALQRTATGLGLAATVAALPILLVCVENKRNYGWFGTCEARSAEFHAAYAAMQRVRVGPELPGVPVAQAARQAMAQASPRFAELERHLAANPDWAGWAGSTEFLTRQPVPAGEIGAGVMPAALRTAAARAGHSSDAGRARYFFKHLARDLNDAIDSGRLPAGSPAGASFGEAWSNLFAFGDTVIRFSRFSARPLPSTGTPDQLNLFRDMTGERLSPPTGELDVVGATEYLQNLAKVDRLHAIGKGLRPFLLGLVILASVVALLRVGQTAWQRRWTYPLTIAVAVAAGVTCALWGYACLEAGYYPVASITAFAPVYPLVLVCTVAIGWDAVAAWWPSRPPRPDSTGNGAGAVSV